MAANEEVVVRLSTIDNLSGTLRKVQGELKALRANANAVSSGSGRGMDGLTRSTLNYGGALKHVNAQMTGFTQGLNRTISRTGVGLAALSGGALALGLKSASSFELSRSALGALLGDTAKGNKLFEQMQSYNFKAPFDLEGIAAAGQTLLQFGVSGEKMMPVLKGLGDVASMSAGNPIDNLKSMALAMGQISSAGVMRAQDMNQLIQAGFPAYALLSEISGKTSMQLRKDMETGLTLPADKFLGAVTSMQAKSLQAYKGGAAKQNETLFGQWSNFKDRLKINLADMLGTSLPQIKTELNGLGTDLGKMIHKIGPELPGLIDSFSKLTPVLVDVTGGFADLMTKLAPVVAKVADALGPKGVERLLAVLMGYAALKKVTGVVKTFSEALAILKGVEAGTGVPTPGGPGPGPKGGKGGGLLPKLLPLAEVGWFSHLATRHADKGAKWYDLTQGVLPSWIPEPHPTTWLSDIKGQRGKGPDWFNAAGDKTRGALGMAPVTYNVGSINVHNPGSNVDVARAVQTGIENHIRARQARGGG